MTVHRCQETLRVGGGSAGCIRRAQHDGAGAPGALRPRTFRGGGPGRRAVGEATCAMGSGGIPTIGARGAVGDDAGRLSESVVGPRDACGGLSTTEPVPPGRFGPALSGEAGRDGGEVDEATRAMGSGGISTTGRDGVITQHYHTSFQLRMVLLVPTSN